MIALRFVLDTNVIVSAALRPDGLQRVALDITITKPSSLYISQPVFAEYGEVLARRRFGIARGERSQLLQLIKRRARFVIATAAVRAAGDTTDNKFLECAEAARADYLVTGNVRDFPRFWKGTKVITARELVEIVAPHRPV
jgi:uncharacterized protein